MASRLAWAQLSAMAEFASRPHRQDFAADEVAAAFHLSWLSAAGEIEYARAVARRLPVTFAALAAGKLDPVHVKIIEDVTSILSDADAAIADEILAALAESKTYAELRRSASRLVLKLDPEAARKRKEPHPGHPRAVRAHRSRRPLPAQPQARPPGQGPQRHLRRTRLRPPGRPLRPRSHRPPPRRRPDLRVQPGAAMPAPPPLQASRRLAAGTAPTRRPGLAHPGRTHLHHHPHPVRRLTLLACSRAATAVIAFLGPLSVPAVLATLDAANQAIARHEPEGMGTTVTGLASLATAGGDHLMVFNVGDSRVYRVVGARLDQVTVIVMDVDDDDDRTADDDQGADGDTRPRDQLLGGHD